MTASTLVIIVVAVLSAASVGIFIYCCWSDRYDDNSGRGKTGKEQDK